MTSIIFVLLLSGALLVNANLIQVADEEFPLAIIHINDFHARFEETNNASGSCKEGDECIGGYARLVTKVKELLNTHSDKNAIYLNAGDNFQGTLWYTLLRWNVTSLFLNMLPADAMTLGNHEFDDGVEGCVPFIKDLTTPMVVANMDASEEPEIQGTYNKSVVIERNGRKIGIIGVVLQSIDILADTGKLKFLDETESVKEEAERLHNDGVDIIIVLSHSGLDVDEYIAENVGEHVDVIVGGHSHTYLYTGNDHPGIDRPVKEYPVVVQQKSGHKVYIVQASAYAKYVGEFIVYFNDEGKITRFEGNPVFLGPDVIPDPQTIEAMKPVKEEIDKLGLEVVGSSLIPLDRSPCNYQECNIGNLVTDSYRRVAINLAKDDEWTAAEIAFSNVGGIRTSMEKGEINYGDAIAVQPFGNLLTMMEIRGDRILEALEYSVLDANTTSYRNMMHYSGMKVTFNLKDAPGMRVKKVEIVCRKCSVPVYEPIDVFKYYSIILPEFIAGGGDGFTMFRDYGRNKKNEGLDIDAFKAHIKAVSPILNLVEGRIQFV